MSERVELTEAEREVLLTPCACGHTINDHGTYAACWTCEDNEGDCDTPFEALLVERIEAILTARLEQVEDARDEQERMVMQVRASADEWWGRWERENARAEKAEAALGDLRAKVEALADWWARSGDESGYDIACADHARQLRDLLKDAP